MSNYEKKDTTGWDAEQVRRSTERSSSDTNGRKKRRRRRGRGIIGILFYIIFVVAISALLAGVGWLLANDLCAFNKPAKTVVVEVGASDTFETMTDRLKEEGLIEYKWFFKLFGEIANADEKIKEGIYQLNTDMDYRALIAYMSTGAVSTSTETVTVTIPEGYTVKQIAALLAKNGVSTEEALLDSAANTVFENFHFIDNENLGNITRLEGYLFPDTYEFYVGEKASSALSRLLSNFNNKLTDEMLDTIDASGRTVQQVVIVASLIERETDGTDQANIASVIYNRLADTGSHGTYGVLNIDASVLYGLPEDHTGGLTSADLEYDSPYNLYKYAGLPPTAIGNPGLKALEAAVSPASTEFYYYALGKDGVHHYSKTLNEHNAFLSSSQYIGN